MNLVEDLFAFIGPRPVAVQEMGRSRVLLLSAFAVLSALVLVAVWGVAAGPRVALASAVVGVIVGSLLFARGPKKLWPDPDSRRKMAAPAILLCVLQTAALLQLAAVSPHVMPQRTALGRGIDALAPMGSTP